MLSTAGFFFLHCSYLYLHIYLYLCLLNRCASKGIMSLLSYPRKTSVVQQILLLGFLLTLANLAGVIHKSSRVYLFQQAQCLAYYRTHDPTQIDSHSRVEEALCKLDKVQSRLSITDGIDSFLSNLPGKSSYLPSRPYSRLYSCYTRVR